jgi:hypothetical protein
MCAAAILLLILRNRRLAVLDRVLYLCRTLTLTATLSNKDVTTRAVIQTTNSAYNFKSTLYRIILQLVEKMLDVRGSIERMSGVRFSSLKMQNPNAKLLSAKFREC